MVLPLEFDRHLGYNKPDDGAATSAIQYSCAESDRSIQSRAEYSSQGAGRPYSSRTFAGDVALIGDVRTQMCVKSVLFSGHKTTFALLHGSNYILLVGRYAVDGFEAVRDTQTTRCVITSAHFLSPTVSY